MTDVAPAESVPLPTLLSQALVAYTIELDNEAEHRLPHRTTNEDDPPAREHAPWLVSYPLWANVLRYVPDDGLTVSELRTAARTDRLLLGGLTRWGYIRLTPPAGAAVTYPPPDEVLVRTTRHARTAGEVWRVMPALVESRWRARFGDAAVDGVRHALIAIDEQLAIDPPDYLPVVFPAKNGTTEAAVARVGSRDAGVLDLPALLSASLDAFTLDFEAESKICLAISANTLRVLTPDGVRLRDLPSRTGVSKEANAMCAGWLERHGCAERAPDPHASRGQVLRLTRKGEGAQAKYRRILTQTENSWRTRFGAAVDAVRDALEPLVGDGTRASSPLAAGLEPHPDNWRARVRPAETLPQHPMVLHRGAYPDGS